MRADRTSPLILGILMLVLPTPSVAIHLGKLLLLVALVAINTRWGEPRIGYAFVLLLCVMGVSLIPAFHLWNPLVVPAISFAMVAWVYPRWLSSASWLLRGRPSTATWLLAVVMIALSAAALVGWAYLTQPDLSRYADMVGSGISAVVAAAIVFALFTAIAEEVIFRGVLWQALAEVGFAPGPVLIIQALAFGVLHVDGVPSGLSGVGLATVYAVALGGIRWLSQGLLMPVVVHAFADLTIFLIVMRLAERW
jgi:membrane protease YdiL (CAAX protease family)